MRLRALWLAAAAVMTAPGCGTMTTTRPTAMPARPSPRRRSRPRCRRPTISSSCAGRRADVPLTKGIGFVNVRAFVANRFGGDAWGALLSTFPPADADTLRSAVTMGWYDLELYARLIRAVDRRFGQGNLAMLRDLGRFEAERDLTTIHRWLLRLIRPSIAVEQIGRYWRRFHDTGEWHTERRGDREVAGTLRDWGVVDDALCVELGGYLHMTLELLGGRDIELHHPNAGRRDTQPACSSVAGARAATPDPRSA